MEENTNTVVEHNSLALIERAQIDAQIATAQMYKKHTPKMLSAVKAAMLSFATLDEETASGCFYTLPRGGKAIQGPSIRMAEIAVSCYGNIRNSVRVIDVVTDSDNPHVIVQAVCHDLETNVAISIEKRRRIVKKKRKDTIDEDDINLAVNACTAIGFRDAAFKVIPLALVKPVVAAAKKVAIGDIKSLDVTRQRCVDRLNQMGVPTDRILSVVDCLKVDDIGQSELELLFGLGTALKDGDTSIEEAFPKIVTQKAGIEGLKERIKDETPTKEQTRPPESAVKDTPQPESKPEPEKPKRGRKKGLYDFVCPECQRTYQYGAKEGVGVQCECGKAKIVRKPKEESQPESEPQPEPKMTVDDVQPEESQQEQPDASKLEDYLYVCLKCGHKFDQALSGKDGKTQCPNCLTYDIAATEDQK